MAAQKRWTCGTFCRFWFKAYYFSRWQSVPHWDTSTLKTCTDASYNTLIYQPTYCRLMPLTICEFCINQCS